MLVFAVLAASLSLYLVSGQLDQYGADAGVGGEDGGLEVNIPGNREGLDICLSLGEKSLSKFHRMFGKRDPADFTETTFYILGVPGEDYPIYANVPDTGFTCDGLVEGGYYADPNAECQAFHICANDGDGGLLTYR